MASLTAAKEIDEKVASYILTDLCEKERAHVVNAFKYYKQYSLDRIHKSEKIISTLPASHQRRLEKYKTYLTKFKKCIDTNNKIVNLILKDVDTMFEYVGGSVDTSNDTESFEVVSQEQHKMQHDVEKILKHIVRDWSDVGAEERKQCHTPILDEIEERFPADEYSDRRQVKILVPGAGLGRLAWEISSRGYTCQGNEFSLFMLFASNFILNRCLEANIHTIHPWVHHYVNHLTCEHQLRSVQFPDVRVAAPRPDKHLSITAGEFLKIYTEKDEWSCVATCFFIDCAPNVIEFVERIYAILKPGGYWINLGPLLYYYSDMPTESSVEPPYDILLEIIRDVGFDILKEQAGVKTKYAQNTNSMMQYEYESVFFVCRKPEI